MAALRALLPVTCLLASLLPACGGSASETPPPLPPLPLNEPYRARGAVEARAEVANEDVENEPAPAAPRIAAPPGSATWGSSAPEPLPELSPK